MPDIQSGSRGGRERLSGRLRDGSQNPCPEPRVPACRIEEDRGDPRLRSLRQAARDLVLVHRRRRLPGRAGRLQQRLRALRGRDQLPLGEHPRRHRRGPLDRRTSAAGRCRSDGTRDGAVSNTYRVGLCPTWPSPCPAGSSTRPDRYGLLHRGSARRRAREPDRGSPKARDSGQVSGPRRTRPGRRARVEPIAPPCRSAAGSPATYPRSWRGRAFTTCWSSEARGAARATSRTASRSWQAASLARRP